MAAEQEALSDFWRKRQSNNLPEELANVLNGARGYVGFFGSDFSVGWGRDSSVSTKSRDILLDYSPLKDKKPPFDGQDIDLVMGSAIHECGHIKWSYPATQVKDYYVKKQKPDYYQQRYGMYLSSSQEKEASELKTVANIIEDFYVENKVSETYPTLGAYLRESRKLSADKELPHNLHYDLSTDNPTFDSVLTMWGAIALIDKEIPKDASAQSKNLLNKLINYTIGTVKQKPQKRLQTAYKIWEELNALDRASDRERQRQINKMKQEREQKEKEQKDDSEPSPDGEPSEESGQEDNGEETKGEETEEGKDKSKEETEDKDRETEGEEVGEETSSEESASEEETPESSGEDTENEAGEEVEGENEGVGEDTDNDGEMESEKSPEEVGEDEEGSPEIEEDLDEPYQDHEELRECYSINPDDKETMPQGLVDAVDEYEEKKPEDITQQVNELLGGSGSREISMELAPSNPAKAQKLFLETRRTAQKVSQLFMQDKRLRTRSRRGLQEGIVDPRRLHKAGASDYKLFERKEILATPSLAVGVLVDASGSMAWGLGGRKTKIGQAISTAMALKTALTMIEGVDLMIMAYNTRSEVSMADTVLHRVYDRKTGEFRPDVEANGGTPSGYAIAGMVSQIGRYLKGKDKLIIHVTDGAPNSHEDVKQAVNYCLQNKIEVMTLTLAQFSDEVKESYHGLCEYLDNIDKLPEAIASLLKKRLEKRILRVK